MVHHRTQKVTWLYIEDIWGEHSDVLLFYVKVSRKGELCHAQLVMLNFTDIFSTPLFFPSSLFHAPTPKHGNMHCILVQNCRHFCKQRFPSCSMFRACFIHVCMLLSVPFQRHTFLEHSGPLHAHCSIDFRDTFNICLCQRLVLVRERSPIFWDVLALIWVLHHAQVQAVQNFDSIKTQTKGPHCTSLSKNVQLC